MPNRPAQSGNSGNLCCRHNGEQERIHRPPFGGRHRRNAPAISRSAAHGGRFRNAVPGNRKSVTNPARYGNVAPGARAGAPQVCVNETNSNRPRRRNVRLADPFDGQSPTIARFGRPKLRRFETQGKSLGGIIARPRGTGRRLGFAPTNDSQSLVVGLQPTPAASSSPWTTSRTSSMSRGF